MALDRLTKITGPGIKTDTNWVGNNANFSGVTTTASSFNVGVTTIHSTLIESHNIKSTGIITATGGSFSGNVTATGGSFSGNVTAVDGTFTGNVSIAGTLTYEDVTNIDSVGIITAPAVDIDDFLDVGSNIKLGNAGVITATSFVGSGAALTGIDATAIKDSGGNVKIQAQASGAIHSGVSTFQDLTVEKSGNLNVNIKSTSGWGALEVGGSLAGYIDIKKPFSDDYDIRLMADGNNNYISSNARPLKLSAQGAYGIELGAYGAPSLQYNNDTKLVTTGIGISIPKDLDVDGHTNLDNVSIAGVTTIANDTEFKIGSNANNKLPFKIKQDTGAGNVNYIDSRFTYFRSHAIRMYDQDNTSHQVAYFWNNQIGLYASNVETLRVAGSGVNILNGDLTVGRDIDVDGHTNLDNVNIAGVTTTTGNVNVGGYVVSQGTSGRGGIFGQIEVGYDNTYLTIQPTSGHNDLHLNFDNGSTVQIGHSNGSTLTVNGNIKPKTDSASDLGLTGTRFRAAYVDTYYGDGSNLTGITGTTINNNANNRLITGSGTANTLEGESTITYDNPTLEINTDTSPYGTLTLNGTTGGLVQFEDNEVTKWAIFGDHALNFYNNANSLSRLYINSSGQMGLGVEPNTNWPTNNDFKALQIGTGACVFGRGSGDEDRGGIAVNWYSDGSNNKYLGNGNAARIYLADGNIYFSTAGANSSGANAAMTLNDRMILSSSGRLGLAGFQHNYTMNSSSTDLVLGDGGGGRGITFWTAGAADNQTISFQCNENLSRAEGEISYGPTATSTATDRNAMMFRTNSAERLRITSTGRFGFNRSAPHYAMHLSPASGETRIDLHMTNDTTGHNAGDGVQFGYQNVAGAYIWNFENTPIYMATNNVKKFEIHATGSTQIYKGDLLLGPDSVSQMEATIRAWGCSLWFTTIDPNYFHDSGGEYRQFYNKGSFRGDNYLTAYNCPIQTGVGPQNRNFWRGANGDTRAEGSLDINVGYRGAWFFIGQTSCASIPYQGSGRYLFDRGSARCSVSFDSFGNSIESGELSFHCGNSPGYNSGNCTIGGRLGSSNSDSTLRMYCVGVNMENYNAPNSKRAGNHLGVSVINEDGTDYGSSRLSENLINNGATGGTASGSGEFNWGNRHSNDRGGTTTFRHSQLLYFDDVQLNSAQWDYLEHYFKVMYGNG